MAVFLRDVRTGRISVAEDEVVSSPEFFHGTIELIEKDVCATLCMTEAETRPLDERVKRFLEKYTDKFTVFE